MVLPTSSNHLFALADIIHSTGIHMLEDDAQDIGYFEYSNRQSHYYHGVYSPDHPSPLHHWQFAIPLIAVGKLMGLGAIGKVMMEEEEEPATTDEKKELFPAIL